MDLIKYDFLYLLLQKDILIINCNDIKKIKLNNNKTKKQ